MSSPLRNFAILSGMGAVLVLAGAASPDPSFTRNTESAARTCFHIRDVEGYSPAKIGERDGVNLRIKNQDVFQVEFVAPCPEAGTAARVKLTSNSATDFVCTGADATLVAFAESGPTRQCAISGLRKLDKGQVAALPENELP